MGKTYFHSIVPIFLSSFQYFIWSNIRVDITVSIKTINKMEISTFLLGDDIVTPTLNKLKISTLPLLLHHKGWIKKSLHTLFLCEHDCVASSLVLELHTALVGTLM